jgi:virulence factor Mce-like protein
MLLTRFVRIQLTIFATLGVIGMAAMLLVYMQVPTLLGVGRVTVTMELPATGGLYRFSNVTYRGAQVGKVTAVELMPNGVRATLSLDSSVKIPGDLQAQVRSVSAVGEQYVDLRPRTDSGPYLHNGSVIAVRDTTIPQPVGPMLDRVSALVDSIPQEKLGSLLDESFQAFDGAGYDMGSLFDSSSRLADGFNGIGGRTRTLAEDAVPFLDSQAQSTDAIRTWAPSLAAFTGQVVTNDPQIRAVLQTGPGAEDEVSRLLTQIKPTLPILLANLTTVGQVAMTYNSSLRQLLVLLPPYVANTQSYSPTNAPNGLAVGDFALSINDPPPCTIGFLPPSSWRSPADTSDTDTPDGLYCKLPQDSPIGVRGARNYPCMDHPGKRAPTVEICDSDKPYEPLAMRPHVLGPYPFDPNLVAQGVPPDDRVSFGDNIFAPVEGTPPPSPATPQRPQALPPPDSPAPPPAAFDPAPPGPANPAPPGPPDPLPAAPTRSVAPPDGFSTAAAPSSFAGNQPQGAPSMAAVHYDPRTGRYIDPEGRLHQQSNLAPNSTTTWKDLLPTA